MTQATLHADGMLTLEGQRYRAARGRGGVRPDKMEGDGATPAGPLRLRRILYRADRVAKPRAAVAVQPLAPQDGWCDDPADSDYNTAVSLPHPARHEALWRNDFIYDVLGILAWNDEPVVPGRGSAIFLHVAAPDYAPTDGCIALAMADLRAVLGAGLTMIEVLA